MRHFITPALALATALSGCAKSSDDVVATYQSPALYEGWSCGSLATEEAAIRRQVVSVAGEQDEAATRDAVAMGVGLVLFWPALFLLAAGDEAAQLSDLKGRYDAVSTAMTTKQCARAVDAQPGLAEPAAKGEGEDGAAQDLGAVAAAPEPEGPRPVEGARLASFSEAQMKTWCAQDWETRQAADGRTEFNPCSRRDAFQ
ncbi:hypothetical protein ACQ5SO_21190 [Rhodovulum sp. DZ06]|uniref:hypothetical protein n=1 Tax=Rhodovulum sp. DZ06 TaxID=3425126 RepID=UPI003D332BD6